MSEKALKIVPAPESRTSPEAKSETSNAKGLFARIGRKRLRTILLVGLPALVLVIGLGIYLSGGRYISTDNDYVGAQKVLITPDISGKLSKVTVHEGERVAAGDALFEIDPVPFRLALQGAQSKLDAARTQFANLKSNYQSLNQLVTYGEQGVALKKRDVERK